ncbi:hypothetical protein XAUC_05710 [Xanthomonas citri pv. aurantifolii str. ICPB 10535]|nr:hypothetical protein XAUC_05710 [Xanthomonas citri pv. aurantifolii str. ICPB 10535]
MGIDLLLVTPRPAFHRPATDLDQIGGRIQIESERVEWVERGDHDVVGQRVAGAGIGPEEDRLRRGLVGRFAPVAQRLDVPLHVVVEVIAELRKYALALGRCQQQILFGEVVAVCGAEAVIIVAARTTAAAIVLRCADAGIRREILAHAGVGIDELEAAIRRCRAGEGQPGARNREAGLRTIARIDRILFDIACAQKQAEILSAAAPRQVHALVGAIALAVLPVVERDLRTVETATGDDVDHTGNRIRTVQRRGAVFEHFDTLDDRQRNGVEIGR